MLKTLFNQPGSGFSLSGRLKDSQNVLISPPLAAAALLKPFMRAINATLMRETSNV